MHAKMLFSPLQNTICFVANNVFSIYVLRGAVMKKTFSSLAAKLWADISLDANNFTLYVTKLLTQNLNKRD